MVATEQIGDGESDAQYHCSQHTRHTLKTHQSPDSGGDTPQGDQLKYPDLPTHQRQDSHKRSPRHRDVPCQSTTPQYQKTEPSIEGQEKQQQNVVDANRRRQGVPERKGKPANRGLRLGVSEGVVRGVKNRRVPVTAVAVLQTIDIPPHRPQVQQGDGSGRFDAQRQVPCRRVGQGPSDGNCQRQIKNACRGVQTTSARPQQTRQFVRGEQQKQVGSANQSRQFSGRRGLPWMARAQRSISWRASQRPTGVGPRESGSGSDDPRSTCRAGCASGITCGESSATSAFSRCICFPARVFLGSTDRTS